MNKYEVFGDGDRGMSSLHPTNQMQLLQVHNAYFCE